jgi:hypothetical protein
MKQLTDYISDQRNEYDTECKKSQSCLQRG